MKNTKNILKLAKDKLSSWKAKTFLIIILLIIGVFIWQGAHENNNDLKTAKVERQKLVETISASGEVKAESSTELRFMTPSKVVWVGIQEGDDVYAGQALVSVDKRQLSKNLKKKMSDYLTSRWDYEQTNDDYEVAGRPLYDVTLTNEEKRIIEKSQFSLDKSVLDVEIADLAVREATLISPIAGTVTAIKGLSKGENLTALGLTSSYVRIVDFSSLQFEVNIDEIDYSKIHKGQKVKIILDAFSDEIFKGTVTFVGKEGEKTATGGVVIPVKVAFDLQDERLVTGLSGDTEFIIEEKNNVLVVPREFVKTINGDVTVNVIENGEVVSKKVEIGLSTLTQTEIVQGLQEGDEVAYVKDEKE